MDDILAKKNRHLFLEEKDNQTNSFIGNINDVANRKTELDTVAAHITNVDTVGNHIDNVDTVANNISDINDAVDNIATVKTFNDNVNNGTMQYLLEAFTTSLNDQGNAWEVRLTQLGESILATTSAFNYSTVVAVSSDIPANGTLMLPNSMKYKVGTHMLMVSWNGTVCYAGEQYDEVGAYGVWATSIKLNQPAKTGDKIQLRVVALTDQSSYADITEAAVTASQFIASGANTERYLSEYFGDVVNVKNFGAVGNGVNDDTTAFQSAIASGKAIFVPEGTYKLTEDFTGNFCSTGNSTFTGGTINGSTILRGTAQKNNDIINVKDFGAKGDGITDDTAAFQAASVCGKPVHIPAGTYKLTSHVYATNMTKAEDGVSFTGKYLHCDKELCRNGYKKAVVAELPFKFADYEVARTACGSPSYIHPQGICFDENGNLYIKYDGDTYNSVVKYNNQYIYQGYVLIGAGGESIVVKKEGANLYIYDKGTSAYIYKYDITNVSFSGETLTGAACMDSSTKFTLNTQYSYDSGRWLCECAMDYGDVASRTRWVLADDNFDVTGEVYIPISIVGFMTSDRPYYPYVPKIQGSALYKDKIVISHGASRKTSETYQRNSDLGFSELSLDGSVLNYFVVDETHVVEKLTEAGYTVTRTESEGTVVHPNGGLYSILMTNNLSGYPDDANTSGILILHERTEDGIDFSNGKSKFSPFNMQRIINGVFPRTGNKIYNPITGDQITTLAQLLTFMRNAQVPRTTFFYGAVALTPITGITLDAWSFVVIESINMTSFVVRVESRSSGLCNYVVSYNSSNSSWEVYDSSQSNTVYDLTINNRVWSINSRSTLPGFILGPNESSDSSNFSSLMIGGGSSVARAATYINFYVATGAGTTGGKNLLRLTGTNVYPNGDLDGQVNLGLASAKWNTVYASTGSINTSDERYKLNIDDLPEAIFRACDNIDFKQFMFKDAYEKKGDNARLHIGVIAQRIKESFNAEGIDPFKYGLLCYDEWESTPAETDEVGVVIVPEVPAGNRYSVRYDELLSLECAYLRYRLIKMQKQIDQLSEQQNAKIEALMQRISALENNH